MDKPKVDVKNQSNCKIRYYVRASTLEQNVCRQLLSYDKADHIYIDRMSGKNRNRPELQRMLNDLHKGDTVVVKSLDRLSRSAKDMLELVEEITNKGAFLQVLDLNLDTSTAIGQFVLLFWLVWQNSKEKLFDKERWKEWQLQNPKVNTMDVNLVA